MWQRKVKETKKQQLEDNLKKVVPLNIHMNHFQLAPNYSPNHFFLPYFEWGVGKQILSSPSCLFNTAQKMLSVGS